MLAAEHRGCEVPDAKLLLHGSHVNLHAGDTGQYYRVASAGALHAFSLFCSFVVSSLAYSDVPIKCDTLDPRPFTEQFLAVVFQC